MKKFLVVLLAFAMVFGLATTALAEDVQIPEFNDVAELSAVTQNSIHRLAVLGVFQGDEGLGGAFRHGDTLTRAEFAKIVCLLAGVTTSAEAEAMRDTPSTIFPDVTTGWFTGWVQIAGANKFFQGDNRGYFNPNSPITYQEVSAVLLRVVGYNDYVGGGGNNVKGVWPDNYNMKARAVGLSDDTSYVGRNSITRADMAIMANNALELNMVTHINDPVIAALQLAQGNADQDWFVEASYKTNEDVTIVETILHRSFNAVTRTVRFAEAVGRDTDETTGWAYEDFTDKELQLDVNAYKNGDVWEFGTHTGIYGVNSSYYITGGYNFPDLSNMIAKMTVKDNAKKETMFVEVQSSYQYAQEVYKDGSRINVDGKSSAKGSNDFFNITGQAANFVDLTADITDTDFRVFDNTSSSNKIPAKVYLDADGRVYAVKNYNAFDVVEYEDNDVKREFGIVDAVDDKVTFKNEDDLSLGKQFKEIDTAKTNYIIFKDGELVLADALEANDVLFDLGDSVGTRLYVAKTPATGEFERQLNGKLKIAGVSYAVIDQFFFLSKDGGKSFEEFNVKDETITVADFKDASYATHYNFSKAAFMASTAEAADAIVGVVVDVSVSGTMGGGEKHNGITILGLDGKEVYYDFTAGFKTAYNDYLSAYHAAKATGNPADLTAFYTSDQWTATEIGDYLGMERDEAEGTAGVGANFFNYDHGQVGIGYGMIVELDVNSDGKIASIEKARPYNPNPVDLNNPANQKDYTVGTNTSRSRITIPAALHNESYNKSRATVNLNTDCVIYEVTAKATGLDFSSAKVVSISSLLNADFYSRQVVVFSSSDKAGYNADVLYVVKDGSTKTMAVVSYLGNLADGHTYLVDGETKIGKSKINDGPVFGLYTTVDAKVNVTTLIDNSNWDATTATMDIWADDLDETTSGDPVAIYKGLVTRARNNEGYIGVTVETATTGAAVGAQEFMIDKEDTYMFNFTDDEAITNASDLADMSVIVIDVDGETKYVLAFDEPTQAATRLANADHLIAALGGDTKAEHGAAPGEVKLKANATIGDYELKTDVVLYLNEKQLTVTADKTLDVVAGTNLFGDAGLNSQIILEHGAKLLNATNGPHLNSHATDSATYTVDETGAVAAL